MDATHHEFKDLFEQLGLASDEASIRQFCSTHSLGEGEKLTEAAFWTPAQRQFLREAINQDADWAVPMDQLNTSLHRSPKPSERP